MSVIACDCFLQVFTRSSSSVISASPHKSLSSESEGDRQFNLNDNGIPTATQALMTMYRRRSPEEFNPKLVKYTLECCTWLKKLLNHVVFKIHVSDTEAFCHRQLGGSIFHRNVEHAVILPVQTLHKRSKVGYKSGRGFRPALKYNCFNNILLTARSTGTETKKWEEAAH